MSFSRNFGKEIAIAAGLDHARGRAVVIMDADLQHPPEMIEDLRRALARRLRDGLRPANGPLRRDPPEAQLARVCSIACSSASARRPPGGAGDFRLIDRKGVEVLRSLGERARFSKGLYAWIGFKATGVPFVVEERRHGASKWSFRKLFRFAFDGITSFSTVPLRVWTYLGLLISIGSIADGALLPRPHAPLRHGPARLPLAHRLGDVLLRHPAHVARHHRRICRPHLRRGEAATALRGGRAHRRRGREGRDARPRRSPLRAGLTDDAPQDPLGRRLDAPSPASPASSATS